MKNLLLPVFFCAVAFAGCERHAAYDIVARPCTGSASVNYISNRSPLLLSQYAESTVNAKAGKRENICLEQTTRYPFNETVRIVVREANRVTFPLYLRIPEWCAEATAKIIAADGQTSSVTAPAAQYLRIERTWSAGDVVELTLPMHLSLDTWAQNGNSVSLNYGPLTFSLQIDEKYIQKNSAKTTQWDSGWQASADPSQWPSYEISPLSSWNYGLIFDASDLTASFEVIKKTWPADNFPFTVASVPLAVKAKGAKIPGWKIDEHGLCAFVPQSPVPAGEPVEEITLIPMGAARLRISAFPVIR